ncbi:3-dehydroquinate synthase [Candidatus Bilamarchaeum dharawalense]|uniref:3-dehydroquinate synthase n=1 Tax=Candidatus Bilamarchaeum dharawalense TaxID=2885759 RepID=A0A5E4LVM9_9ARCH|nr:3-dehydroquinate synthase [Candidatus Bilamarchaeum dharawalense]
MRVLTLNGTTGSCDIVLGDSIENLKSHCENQRIVVVTDENVRRVHGDKLDGMEMIEIGLGEENKNLVTVEKIYKKLLDLEIDKSTMMIGVGGGIVCDVTGFAASTYVRGLQFGFVPTTLLAQVDASIGGKNGVNLEGYKNLVGLIRQPRFCLCDFEMLKTLPPVELRCGMAEVIKHAAIGDEALFSYLEANVEKVLSLHRTSIEKIVHDSIVVKLTIVKKDELEKGERMKLNFGHTIGHAIEKTTQKKHGEAVAIGMVASANLSVARGMLQKKDAERLENLIKQFGLPTTIPAKDSLMEAIRKDKKKSGQKIKMALLEGIGKAKITEIELEAVVNDLC